MYARVLGVAQDAGVPHIGCRCAHCERFRGEPLLPACLGIVGDEQTYLIDATPAIAEQVAALPSSPTALSTRSGRPESRTRSRCLRW